jgi:hypothetical protein
LTNASQALNLSNDKLRTQYTAYMYSINELLALTKYEYHYIFHSYLGNKYAGYSHFYLLFSTSVVITIGRLTNGNLQSPRLDVTNCDIKIRILVCVLPPTLKKRD